MSSVFYSIHAKTIFVTGANQGLGKALVLELATQGAKRILAAVRDLNSLDWLNEIDKKLADRITPVRLDLTDSSSYTAFENFAETEVIINNAAICLQGSLLELSMDQLRLEWETNFFAPLQIIRLGVQHCPRLEVIANIGSKYRYVSFPVIGNYCATKAALSSITDGLRYDLKNRGIQIQMFYPGAMDTRMALPFSHSKTSTASVAEKIVNTIGNQETDILLTPDSIAMFEHFFANPDQTRKEYETMTFSKYFTPDVESPAQDN